MKLFSLVISTRNRPFEIRKLLNSVLLPGNAAYIYEIVVVDQSDESNSSQTESVLSEFSSLPLKYVRDELKGLSNGRNLGLKVAELPHYVCFPDDDCWYPENFFGKIIDIADLSRFEILQTYYREPDLDNPRRPPTGLITRSSAGRLRACSVGIIIDLSRVDRDLISFDVDIGAGTSLPGGEESDLLFRLLTAGKTIFQCNNPYVFHKIYDGRLVPSRPLFAARSYVQLKNWRVSPVLIRFLGGFAISLVTFPFSSRGRMSFLGRVDACRVFIRRVALL